MVEPNKPIELMTPEELKEFRKSLPCDDLGPTDTEGVAANAEHTA